MITDDYFAELFEKDQAGKAVSGSGVVPLASNAIVPPPAGAPMNVPEGNLGIVARLLLSLILTLCVAAYARL